MVLPWSTSLVLHGTAGWLGLLGFLFIFSVLPPPLRWPQFDHTTSTNQCQVYRTTATSTNRMLPFEKPANRPTVFWLVCCSFSSSLTVTHPSNLMWCSLWSYWDCFIVKLPRSESFWGKLSHHIWFSRAARTRRNTEVSVVHNSLLKGLRSS